MLVMSIDPGESTGVVVVDTRKKMVLYSATIPIQEAYGIALKSTRIEQILIEDIDVIHDFASNATISRYYQMFLEMYDQKPIVKIKPGAWKPIAKAQKWKFVHAASGHEQDAFNMFRYWLLTVGRTKISDGDVIKLVVTGNPLERIIL